MITEWSPGRWTGGRRNGTQTAALWRSRCGHEGRALDHVMPDFRSLTDGTAAVGRPIRRDLLDCSRCVLLCPDAT